jgi:O-antigen ligase
LIFLSLLLFQYAMHSKSRSVRFVFLATVGLAFAGVFFCFSRGSWLGACFVCMGLLCLYPKIVIRSGVLLLLVVVPILATSLFSREANFALERLKQADTAESRITGLVASLRMTQARPWYGWGYHNYDSYDNRFIIRIGNLPYKIRTSHNTFLTVAAEMGVIALFLYLYPTAKWLLASLKAWRHLPRNGFWSRKLLAMLWLLMLHQFVVSNFMDMIRFNLFGTTIGWIALGLIASMVYPQRESGSSARRVTGEGSRSPSLISGA